MRFPLQIKSSDITKEVLGGLENWCRTFNKFAVAFFLYMKFIFFFILLSIGILTLLRLRGIYKVERTKLADADNENMLKRPRLILGTFYIAMAFGILFNYFTFFLIIVLEPLPDRFIFDFINFSGRIDPKAMNRIEDLNAAKYPHEKTIYYCVAMASLGAILDVVISIWYIIDSSNTNHRKTFTLLMSGVILGMLAGWTTCLPLFL